MEAFNMNNKMAVPNNVEKNNKCEFEQYKTKKSNRVDTWKYRQKWIEVNLYWNPKCLRMTITKYLSTVVESLNTSGWPTIRRDLWSTTKRQGKKTKTKDEFVFDRFSINISWGIGFCFLFFLVLKSEIEREKKKGNWLPFPFDIICSSFWPWSIWRPFFSILSSSSSFSSFLWHFRCQPRTPPDHYYAIRMNDFTLYLEYVLLYVIIKIVLESPLRFRRCGGASVDKVFWRTTFSDSPRPPLGQMKRKTLEKMCQSRMNSTFNRPLPLLQFFESWPNGCHKKLAVLFREMAS